MEATIQGLGFKGFPELGGYRAEGVPNLGTP